MLLVTVVGFEIFNAGTLKEIGNNLGELIGINTAGLTSIISNYYIRSYSIIIILAISLSTPLVRIIVNKLENKKSFRLIYDIACYILLILSIAYLVDGSYNPFLYFRF